ncbi:peptide-methionine (S)-S-oxide reductase [Cupriavidus sp. YR651]|uniref:peptide-methionine (S)-S-oxide reductase MsrA n=1 Tax=Cupriavidus sp. YR651 TaxID=1855315 RepID=UPI0008832ECA|nr:peptide-methionine (S)-S-oxide reductase MsrA [Cupriavidus sp. YR651]SDE03177.1 peptide-methionine (S)-S-oxide reductase [Cupriavidus sp. YR651]
MHQRAVLAGGCFWGMRDFLRKRAEVASTRVGYTGGEIPDATYRNHDAHSEGIEIVLDTTRTSYRSVLEYFFQIHGPATLKRRGGDSGSSYHSAAYYIDDEQTRIPNETIAEMDASGLREGEVVAEVDPVGDIRQAELEHQDYLEKQPGGYTCHLRRPGWVLPERETTGESIATPSHTGADA